MAPNAPVEREPGYPQNARHPAEVPLVAVQERYKTAPFDGVLRRQLEDGGVGTVGEEASSNARGPIFLSRSRFCRGAREMVGQVDAAAAIVRGGGRDERYVGSTHVRAAARLHAAAPESEFADALGSILR